MVSWKSLLIGVLGLFGLILSASMALFVSYAVQVQIEPIKGPPEYLLGVNGKRVRDSLPQMSNEKPAVIQMSKDGKMTLIQGRKASAPPVAAPEPGASARWDD